MKSSVQNFLRDIKEILNPEDICVSGQAYAEASSNSLGIHHHVEAVLTPRLINQIQAIVKAANAHHVALYPVSRGKNIGYGEMTPYQSGQVVLNLKHLSAIREYSSDYGEILIEAGVTQEQLADYLNSAGALHWADMTGAPQDASIVGNYLEAGFGHSPLGDHRKHVLQMELVLADGTLFTTSEMPSLGPDLAQLFIQSNFAIVTAIRIPLLPVPESCLTYVLSFASEEKFLEAIPVLAKLRSHGVMNSFLHSGNATRALATGSYISESSPLTDQEALGVLNSSRLLKAGVWTSVGAIYGFKNEVKEKSQILNKQLGKYAQVRFFSDFKMRVIDHFLSLTVLRQFSGLNSLRGNFELLKTLHRLLRGQPSNIPTQSLYSEVLNVDSLGLIWFAPVVTAKTEEVGQLISTARSILAKHGFSMPLTLTMVSHKKITAVFNITFDRSKPLDTERAHRVYEELSQACVQMGFFPYRMGILGKQGKCYSGATIHILQSLKNAFDPNNILAPGRYGIGVESRGDYF